MASLLKRSKSFALGSFIAAASIQYGYAGIIIDEGETWVFASSLAEQNRDTVRDENEPSGAPPLSDALNAFSSAEHFGENYTLAVSAVAMGAWDAKPLSINTMIAYSLDINASPPQAPLSFQASARSALYVDIEFSVEGTYNFTYLEDFENDSADFVLQDGEGNNLGNAGSIGPGRYRIQSEYTRSINNEIGNLFASSSQSLRLTPVDVPAPATLWILVPGLLGLVGYNRRQPG